MGIRAANIIIGSDKEPKKPKVVEQSLSAIREKVESIPPKPNKVVEEEALITYKQSAFLSDMLQSNKD